MTDNPSLFTSPTSHFLRELTLRNLLSFGPEAQPIALERLNVLIGPNGSGKSNFIEVVTLLSATTGDLHAVIRRGGGVREWIWKGAPKQVALLDVVVSNPQGTQPLRHVIAFREENQTFRLDDERIENAYPYSGTTEPYFFYRYQQGRPVLNINGAERRLAHEMVESDASILAQRRDPEAYPEVSYLARAYEKIRVYRERTFGRNTVFREPQKADMRNDRLEEDFSNVLRIRVARSRHTILG